MPPSNPFSGRLTSKYGAVAVAGHERGAAFQRPNGPRGSCAADFPQSPSARARQSSVHGHCRQDGCLGVHTSAPRSISACAKSPARASGTSDCASRRSSGLLFGSGSATRKEARDDALGIGIHRRFARIEGDRGDGARGIGADARQLPQAPRIGGKPAADRVGHPLRRKVKIARARVIAEPRPGRPNVVERSGGQRLHRRPALQEIVVMGPTTATVVCCSMISLSQTR